MTAPANRFRLHYGESEMEFALPFTQVIPGARRSRPSAVADLAAAIQESLNHLLGPVDTGKLGPDSRVVIVCDDYTRPTPVQDILPQLTGFLEQKGVRKENIDILIAAGFHRKMTPAELQRKFGPGICGQYRIHHHDALDEDQLCYLGMVQGSIPVYINRLAAKADFLIGVGTVEIHPWAGFAGGPKIICPGAAGKKSINFTHALPVTAPQVAIGQTLGNPFWESILAASRLAGLDMVVNVVLNESNEVCAIFSGEAAEVQQQCIGVFKRQNEIVFPEPADIVITTSNPKYQYWGQAAIAGYNAARVVREGGTRIVLAACPEGLGDSSLEAGFYSSSLSRAWRSPDAYWDECQGRDFENSRNACAVYRHLDLLRKSDLIMVAPGLADMQSQKVVGTMDQAIHTVLRKYGRQARVIIYDMGAMVLPSLAAGSRTEPLGGELNEEMKAMKKTVL